MLTGLAETVLGITGGLFGDYGTATVSRPHDLRNGGGQVVGTLELAANAALGATALSLRLPAAAPGFAGKVPAGIVVTLAGVPYTVTARAQVASGALTVVVTPGVAAAAVAGTPVTIASAALFTLPQVKRQELRVMSVPPALLASVTFAVLVIKAQAPAGYAPEVGDIVTEASGRKGRVAGVGRDSAGVWELLCGSSA